jgi:hypothetical protein
MAPMARPMRNAIMIVAYFLAGMDGAALAGIYFQPLAAMSASAAALES